MMRTIDLNQDELAVFRDIVTKEGVRTMTVEDCKKVRLERKVEFLELLSYFYDTTPEQREAYLIQLPKEKKDIELEESILDDQLERKAQLKDSAKAILGMDQESWDKLPDATQTKILQEFELIREAGRDIAEKDIDSRTPEDIRTILAAPGEEWEQLPETLTQAVLRKFEKLAG